MRWPLGVLLLLTTACDGPRPPSSVHPRDVGPRVDAGDLADAGERKDSGTMDGASPGDAGSFDDAEPADGETRDAAPADAATPDAGGPTDSGLPPLCYQTCAQPSDCASASNALLDADNYLCNAGACEYRGCLSADECTSVYGPGYVCVQQPGYTIPACVLACTTPSDCALQNVLFDADNYACVLGGCQWLGCNSAQECQTVFNDPSYVCEPQAGLQFNNCVRPCADVSECVAGLPAYDSDNYACTGARCRYLGCNDSAECQGSFQTGAWECR